MLRHAPLGLELLEAQAALGSVPIYSVGRSYHPPRSTDSIRRSRDLVAGKTNEFISECVAKSWGRRVSNRAINRNQRSEE